MRRILCILAVVLMFSANCFAADWEGIWATTVNDTQAGFFSIHRNGNAVVAITLGNDWEWGATQAIVSPNDSSAEFITVADPNVNVSLSANFIDDNNIEFIQRNCMPNFGSNSKCAMANGTSFTATRIF